MARGLTVLLLFYVSATPGLILNEIFAARPFVHLFRGYGKAFFLTTLLCGLVVYWRRAVSLRVLLTVSMLAGAAAVYMLLDVAHYGAPSGILRLGKDLLYNKVTSSYLTSISVFGLFLLIEAKADRTELLRTTIAALSVFAGISLGMWLLIEGGRYAFGDHGVTNNNFQAYESACVLFALLFFALRQFSGIAGAALIALHGAVPIVHQSRGGMLVALSVLTAYLVGQRALLGWTELVQGAAGKTVIATWIALALAVGGAITPNQQSSQSEWRSVSSRFVHTLESSQWRDNPDSNSEISSSDNVVSAYSRLATTALAAKAFLASPVIGIGIWSAYKNIEVAGYGIHGLLPLVAAAYGALGLIPLLVVIGVLATNDARRIFVSRCAAGVFVLVAVFVNAFPPWLGLLLWVGYRVPDGTHVPSPTADRVVTGEPALPA